MGRWLSWFVLGALWAGCGGKGAAGVMPPPNPGGAEEFDPLSLGEEEWLIEPVDAMPDSAPARPVLQAPAGLLYRIQIAALGDLQAAQNRRDEVALVLKEPIQMAVERGLYVVRSVDFASRQQALDFMGRLRAGGLDVGEAFVLVVDSSLSGGRPQGAAPVRSSVAGEPTSGWRLLIGQFLANEEADQLKEKAVQRLRRQDIEVVFEAPWYKAEVGFFLQKAEAQEWSERLARRGFSNTLKKVRGEFADESDGN